jgi:hypothetical protein
MASTKELLSERPVLIFFPKREKITRWGRI